MNYKSYKEWILEKNIARWEIFIYIAFFLFLHLLRGH